MPPTGLDSALQQLNSLHFSKRSIHDSTKEFTHLRLLLFNLMRHHEGNSVLLIGPPGSGKTSMITTAFESVLADKDKEDLHPAKMVTLSGLLSKDLRSSIATLVQELKMQSEFAQLLEEGNNFEDRLADVLQLLRTSLATKFKSKPLVIVLDRFDLFTEHRAQALLYNLLDTVQQKESPLLVIGVTCRVDILELLEKRVKSRFSHRALYLSCPSISHYLTFAKDLLTIRSDSKVDLLWNASVANFFSLTTVEAGLRRLYKMDKTVGTLVQFLTTLLLCCGEDGLTDDLCTKTLDQLLGSSTLQQVLDLTETQMYIVFAVYQVTKGGNAAFNLSKLEDILRKAEVSLAKTATGKEQLGLAFQCLVRKELLTAVDGKGDGGRDSFYKCEMRAEELSQAIKAYPNLPTIFQSLT